jgi:hypothetical protein
MEDQERKIVLREESTEVALSPEQEAKALLDEASKSVHQILKFNEDHYHIRKEPVPTGTRYYAHPANWERQWIRFDDDKVTERIRVRVVTKKLLPSRDKLSDPELENTDNDPWSNQNVIPFENTETGELAAFTTQSIGGRMAIEELVKAYSKAVLAGKSRGLPIIELRISSFKSGKKGYQRDVPRPDFPIVDWENPESAPAPAPTIIPPEMEKAKAGPKHIDEDDGDFSPADDPQMDDEIPF